MNQPDGSPCKPTHTGPVYFPWAGPETNQNPGKPTHEQGDLAPKSIHTCRRAATTENPKPMAPPPQSLPLRPQNPSAAASPTHGAAS